MARALAQVGVLESQLLQEPSAQLVAGRRRLESTSNGPARREECSFVFEIFFTSFAVPPNADAATDDDDEAAAGVRNDTMGSSGANFVQKSVYEVGSAHFIRGPSATQVASPFGAVA